MMGDLRGNSSRWDRSLKSATTRPLSDDFSAAGTAGFTDKHLNERVGIVIRLNETATISLTDFQGHKRVSYGLLRKVVDP